MMLEEGEHIVEMSYHTPGIYTGLTMSLVGIVLSLLLYHSIEK